MVAFESPKRLPAALRSLAQADPSRVAAVCRELTKRFEEVVVAPAVELAERFAEAPRGEITLVLAPREATADRPAAEAAALDAFASSSRPARLAAWPPTSSPG